MDVVYFVVLVGVLIFVHELGHFAFAKFFGVRVLRFSLGFGPKIFGFRLGETEYVVGALPLGGYVKMLGESAKDEVRPGEEDRSFEAQGFFRKMAIILAGPAMNLAFPLILFFAVSVGERTLAPPVIGTVLPGLPADGRLLPGDRVLAVDDEEISTYHELNRILRRSPGVPLELRIERDGEVVSELLTPVRHRVVRELDREEEVGIIGVYPNHPAPVIGVLPGSAAEEAKLRTFDVVVAVGGRPVSHFRDLEALLDQRGMMVLSYLRPKSLEAPLGGLVSMDVFEPSYAMLTPRPGRASPLLDAGIEPADKYVSHVGKGSPEHRANILPGDRLLTLDGTPIRLWSSMVERLRQSPGEEHVFTLRRGDALHEARVRLSLVRARTDEGQIEDRYELRMSNWVPTYMDPHVANEGLISYAWHESWAQIGEMVELTVYSVLRLVQGKLPVSTLGGPLTILDVAGTAAREGAVNYLKLMAFISVNLGLINLLPIPLLDGGHLLFVLIELITRRPIAPRTREWASVAGFVVLVFIMLIAFKNDIDRLRENRQWPDLGAQTAE